MSKQCWRPCTRVLPCTPARTAQVEGLDDREACHEVHLAQRAHAGPRQLERLQLLAPLGAGTGGSGGGDAEGEQQQQRTERDCRDSMGLCERSRWVSDGSVPGTWFKRAICGPSMVPPCQAAGKEARGWPLRLRPHRVVRCDEGAEGGKALQPEQRGQPVVGEVQCLQEGQASDGGRQVLQGIARQVEVLQRAGSTVSAPVGRPRRQGCSRTH